MGCFLHYRLSCNCLRLYLLLPTIFLCLLVSVFAQSVPNTRGKDFYISFLPNFHADPVNDSLIIYATGEQGAIVTITSRNRTGGLQTRVRTIGLSGVVSASYHWRSFEPYGNNDAQGNLAPRDNGSIILPFFRVESTEDIAVYALNQAVATSDAALIYPVAALGKEYKLLSYNSHGFVSGSMPDDFSTNSQGIVLATEDNTTVTVNASVDLIGRATRNFAVTLQRGQSILLQAEIDASKLRSDITNSTVSADKPIAVFAGHQRSFVPVTVSGNYSRDHLYEQMPPTEQWGKGFYVVPFAPNSSMQQEDLLRIIPLNDNTHVSFNNSQVASLDRFDIFEQKLTRPLYITSDQPILVAILKASTSYSGGVGDPALVLIPPIEQYMKNYTVQNVLAYGTQDDANEFAYNRQFITVIIPKQAVPSFRLDNRSFNQSAFSPIPFSAVPGDCQEYVYSHISVAHGSHKLTANDYFAVIVVGYGDVNSYGYIGGLATKVIAPEDDPLLAFNDTTICLGGKAQLLAKGGDGSYIWRPNTNITCTTCSNPEVSPKVTTKYIVESRDETNCPVYDTVVVTINTVDVDAGPNQSICPGSSVQLQVRGGETFSWKKDNTLSCIDCPNPIATPTKRTLYFVRITDKGGCYKDDTVIVDTKELVTDAGKDSTICNGTTIQLNAIGGKTFQWDSISTLSCLDCQSPIASPKVKTTYYVTARDGDCIARDSVTIDISKPFVDAGNDTTICLGDATNLVASKGKKYEWTAHSSLVCTDCKTTIAKPTVTTTYYVKVYQSDECYAMDSVTVFVSSVAISVSNDTTICIGSDVQLFAKGAETYQWLPSDGLSCTDCPNPIAQPLTTTVYYIQGKNKSSCSDNDTVTVFVENIVPDAGRDTIICKGNSVQINAKGGKNFRWLNPKGLSCADCHNPIATPLETTSYIMETWGDACICLDTITIRVSESVVTVSNDTSLCRGGSAQLTATEAFSYTWLPSEGLSCTDCRLPMATPSLTTVYKCFVRNENGCTAVDSATVFVKNCLVEDTILFDRIIACGDNTKIIDIVNTDQFLKNQIVNFRKVYGDESVFIVRPENEFPLSMVYGDTNRLYITFSPRTNGIFKSQYSVEFESGEKRLLNLVGESIIGSFSISSSDTTGIVPGNNILVTAYISSNDWEYTKTDTLDITAEYSSRMLLREGMIVTGDITKDWTLTDNLVEKNGKSSIRMLLIGNEYIKRNGSIVKIPFKTLIADSEKVQINFYTKPTRYDCITVPKAISTVELVSCFMQGRRLETSDTPFGFTSEQNADKIILHCSIGLDSRTRISVYNSVGELVQIIHDDFTSAGTYEVHMQKNILAHGLYHIVLQSGIYSAQQTIIR